MYVRPRPRFRPRNAGGVPFSPVSLFTSGVAGAWYDPSDYSTLFQDSVGTTPVTAVEQAVRLMLDKSGNNNHALAPNDPSRPILRARYNLLTFSEQFDNAAWVKSGLNAFGSGSVVNATTAPDGTITADFLCEDTTTARHTVYQSISFTLTTPFKYVIYAKQSTRSSILVGIGNSRFTRCVISLVTGVAGAFAGVEAANVTATTTDAGNGWWKITLSGAFLVADVGFFWAGPSNGNESYIGNGTSGIYLWGGQVVPTAVFPANTYQRIAAATDYATAGFLPYLAFDGTDDSFGTNSINFTATDKMLVCAGVTKLSDAAQAVIAELSATIATNNGSFLMTAPNSAAANFNFSSKGTTQVDNTVTSYASPYTAVIVGSGDIAGATNSVKVNGGTATTVTSSQGTGNYGNYPLFIGRRNNASLPFNGNFFQLVVCGKALSASELASTEAYVNSKTGAY